jgi:hypothetical protein
MQSNLQPFSQWASLLPTDNAGMHCWLLVCRYSGGSDAPPTSGLSVPGLKQWQKRFFIFSDTQRMLYYFKSADDVTKGGTARGMVRRRVALEAPGMQLRTRLMAD